MIELNLVNKEKSDIHYEIYNFPDGQNQVKILHNIHINDDLLRTPVATIKTRLNNWIDLEILCCAVASLKEFGIKQIHLYCPLILGSRSDRKFEYGSNNYLKDVICPIINSLKFESVTVMDPHSDVLEACLNNYKKIDNLELIRFALTPPVYYPNTEDNFILVSPDAGATKKIYKLSKQIGFNEDIVTCTKNRDEKGNLSRISVPDFDESKDVIIIDDICDGGASFIGISNELKSSQKRYLIVTHGIFSRGLKELSEYFDGIYCTNSYRNIDSKNEFGQHNEKFLHKIKQLNVF